MPSPAHNHLRPFASLPMDERHRRFRLFDFLMSPFRDVDDRAPSARRRAQPAKPAIPTGPERPGDFAVDGHPRRPRGFGALGEGRGPVRIPNPAPGVR